MLSEKPPRVATSRPAKKTAPSAPVSPVGASARRHETVRPIQTAAARGAAIPYDWRVKIAATRSTAPAGTASGAAGQRTATQIPPRLSASARASTR